MIHISNTFYEQLRSIDDSITQKELKSWQKRIAARHSGSCLLMAGAPARFAKGLGSSCSITTPCQMVR